MRPVQFVKTNIFDKWSMPYMLDELDKLDIDEYHYNSKKMTQSDFENYEDSLSLENRRTLRKAEYQKNIEYYNKTYNKIVEICDKTTTLMYQDFKHIYPNIIEAYLYEKERLYQDVTKYSQEHEWVENAYNIICYLLDTYSKINDFIRFKKFKEKTNFIQMEAECVVNYMKEKLDINIKNFDSKFKEIQFEKDTLLAMKCINKFSSKNKIKKDDTLELFCEYIGKSF